MTNLRGGGTDEAGSFALPAWRGGAEIEDECDDDEDDDDDEDEDENENENENDLDAVTSIRRSAIKEPQLTTLTTYRNFMIRLMIFRMVSAAALVWAR